MYMFDTFANFLSGLGVIGRDKMMSSEYTTRLWSREQLETSFRSDWIARKAIVIPAHDATREWRIWQAEQDQIEKLEATERRLQVQLKLQQALTKARLYGGCCILIGVEGNPEKELDPESIKKDGLKFLHVLAPHQLTIDDLVKDIEDPYYGQPEFYILRDETEKFGDAKIHPSRMVRLLGLDSPDPMANFGWGDPMLQMIHDAVNAAGTVSGSIATMITEAKLDVIKIPGLTEIFSTTSGTNRILKRFSEANVAKSVVNGILMDAEEEWQRIGVNFEGMPEILQMYLQIAAGAADIPVTRFLGRSPAGLNATGDSDLVNYYDRIASDQELRLTPALEKLDKAIQQDALGKFDENIFYEWKPLWQMDEAQKATIAKQRADAAMVDVNSGLIPFEALAKGRGNQLIEDGTYPGLESALEEAIANQELLAEEGLGPDGQPLDPNQGPGGMGGQPPENGGGRPNGGGNGGVPAWMSGDSTGVAGKGVGPFGMRLTRLRTLLRTQLRTQLHDLLVEWDPDKHPRELSGQHGGEFTATGGAPARSAGFVSPSVKSGLDFKGATRELNSRQQKRLRLASSDINKKLALAGVREVNIIGAWKDGKTYGAENSIMSRSDSGWNQTEAATVMKGHLADQKAVLVFQQGPGMSVLAQFDATGDLNKIHKNLVRDGIENHTIVPREGGATIYVAYIDKPDLASLDKAAERYGKGNPVYFQHGKAEFIGDTPEYVGDLAGTGTDRQQRDRARSVYERVIAKSPVPNAEAVWKDVRDYWGAPTNQKGFALTPTAILSEFPNIKRNSVLVTDAAKIINDRAGRVLKAETGVETINEETSTPETDEYLAGVIALELRESLISGAGGEHWYDDTMREAREVAAKIYPGMAHDPDKKFIYTVALAITSQGEEVDNSTRLADEAYTHFQKTGELPEDIKTQDKNIKGNFRKVNKFIRDSGSVKATREFFDTPMTARELTERTGVEPGATGKDDIVYGSAMLGPKIGQGFYQNLNGNFEPITMDMWFMRAFGRITNTGVNGKGMSDQLARVDRALNDGGVPPPEDDEATIKIARDIYKQHEKDYEKYQDEYKSGERKKSELVHASERLVIRADGAMVEQPERVPQRHWMTKVFLRGMEKLEQEHGYKLNPASAQATWWWPEKSLWGSMGVRGRGEEESDYAKSLRKLAKSRGISV